MDMPDSNTALELQHAHSQAVRELDYERRAPAIIDELADDIADSSPVNCYSATDFIEGIGVEDWEIATLLNGNDDARFETRTRLHGRLVAHIKNWLRESYEGQQLVEERLRDD